MKYKLKDLIDFKPGYAFKTTQMGNEGISLIKIKSLKKNNVVFEDSDVKVKMNDALKDYLIYKDDILMALTGDPVNKGSYETWVGRTSKYTKEELAYLNQRICKLIPNEKIINRWYLYYWLIQYDKTYEIASLCRGSANQANISHKDVGEMIIDLPDINIQNKVSTILKRLDDKIELNNKINDNLYNQAVAIYKNKFQSTEQADFCIGDYVLPKRGKNLLSRDAILGNVPVVAGGIEPATYHNTSNTKAPVITISASGANAGYVNLWDEPVWSSDSSYIDNDVTDSVYFWYVTLKTRQREIFDAQTGSAQAHIYPQHIAELLINDLDTGDIFNYEKQVTPFFKMIGQNKKENMYLKQLRNTLLPKLMNGEIDLDKIEM